MPAEQAPEPQPPPPDADAPARVSLGVGPAHGHHGRDLLGAVLLDEDPVEGGLGLLPRPGPVELLAEVPGQAPLHVAGVDSYNFV